MDLDFFFQFNLDPYLFILNKIDIKIESIIFKKLILVYLN